MVIWGVAGSGTARGSAVTAGAARRPWLSEILNQFADSAAESGASIPRATTVSYGGRTARLHIPGRDPTVTALDCDAQYALATSAELPNGPFLLSATVPATGDHGCEDPFAAAENGVHVRFDGPASLRTTDDGITLTMDESRSVTVGVGETSSVGPSRIQVAETVEGLATGLSHLGVAHHTLSPSRSSPGQRSHPPILTTGPETDIPDAIRERKPETGIELRLPASVDSLFVGAPLAYYLGADVTVDDRERPVLIAEGTSIHHEFDPVPSFQDQVAGLLRRLFYLDCLTRRMNPEQHPGLLDTCTLSPEAVRSLEPAQRLAHYLDAPQAAVDAAVPDWHLTTHTQPSLSRARCLSFLLDKLSLIYLSDGSELDQRELLDRTLSDTYLTRGLRTESETSILEPSGSVGEVQGWLAPGTPIDAFKTTPTAYENRYRYRERTGDRLQLSVVLNDMEMSDERQAVAELYRAADLPMDVTVSDQLTTAQLAGVFESRNDFVHFIGHCEDDGLCCPDGTLSMDCLSESRTQTFFLNACGSYQQGLSLIEQGSVAGAVTFTDVLDSHAGLVGTAFAQLLSNGFSIQRALQLARRRIMMSKDYAVVGDGTYALLPGPTDPVVVKLAEDGDAYNVTCEVLTPQGAGESYRLPFDDRAALNGTATELTVSEATVIETLAENSLPVIYEGDFHWSGDLAARLDANF